MRTFNLPTNSDTFHLDSFNFDTGTGSGTIANNDGDRFGATFEPVGELVECVLHNRFGDRFAVLQGDDVTECVEQALHEVNLGF